MKNLKFLVPTFLFLLLAVAGYGQNKYNKGIDNLSRVKIQCEDIANSVKLTWRRNSSEYQEVRRLYDRTQNSIIVMIDAFDSKIRSGKRVNKNDVLKYVAIVQQNSDQLAAYYDAHKQDAGTNSAFNLMVLLSLGEQIADRVFGLVDKYQDYLIERRLKEMHAALDKCKLKAWDSI